MPQQDDKSKAKLEIEIVSNGKSKDKPKAKSESKSKEQKGSAAKSKGAEGAEAKEDPTEDPTAAMFAPKPDYASMGEQSLFGSISPVGQGGTQTQMNQQQQQEQAMMQQGQPKSKQPKSNQPKSNQQKNDGVQVKTSSSRDIVVQGLISKFAEVITDKPGYIKGYKGRPAHHYLGDLGAGRKTTNTAGRASNQTAAGLNRLLMSLAHFFAAKSHLPKVKSPRSDAR